MASELGTFKSSLHTLAYWGIHLLALSLTFNWATFCGCVNMHHSSTSFKIMALNQKFAKSHCGHPYFNAPKYCDQIKSLYVESAIFLISLFTYHKLSILEDPFATSEELQEVNQYLNLLYLWRILACHVH